MCREEPRGRTGVVDRENGGEAEDGRGEGADDEEEDDKQGAEGLRNLLHHILEEITCKPHLVVSIVGQSFAHARLLFALIISSSLACLFFHSPVPLSLVLCAISLCRSPLDPPAPCLSLPLTLTPTGLTFQSAKLRCVRSPRARFSFFLIPYCLAHGTHTAQTQVRKWHVVWRRQCAPVDFRGRKRSTKDANGAHGGFGAFL